MARNYHEAKTIRERLAADLDSFFGKGNEPKQLGTTELKPHRFIVNSKVESPVVKLPPIHERN